ncbi:hypothetical protein BGZ50_007101, partial [Haplosporangium sp. Z 11]
MNKFVVPVNDLVHVETGIKLSKNEERELILQWLKVKSNFAAVYGRQKTGVRAKQETAKQGWARAAGYLNKKAGLSLSAKSVIGRFRRYKDAYFDAAKSSKRSGEGVTSDDQADNFDELLNQ